MKQTRGMLYGLDLCNIIPHTQPENDGDTTLTLSTSSSSRAARSQRNVARENRLYNMKHHPMDDMLQPAKAATKRRKKPSGGETSSSSSSNPSATSLSSTLLALTSSRRHGDGLGSPPRKKRKETVPTRTSTRTKGNRVNYDMAVHPRKCDVDWVDLSFWFLLAFVSAVEVCS